MYLFLSGLYLFAIPVGESPDEPGHLQCIEQVAQTNRLPRIDPKPEGDVWWSRGRIIAGQMCYHMPLYYLVAGVTVEIVADISSTDIPFTFPPTNPRFGPETALFIHDNKPSFWILAEPVTLIGLRMMSIALGLVTVAAAYRITRLLNPERPLFAIYAAILVAGWPQIVYLSRAINNDTLATALAVVTLLILVEVGRPYRFVLAALVSSLAVLTKISVAFTVIAVISVWLLEIWLTANDRRTYLRVMLLCGLIWFVTGFVVTQHPLLSQNLARSTVAFSAVSPETWTLAYWKDVFILTLSSGWARLGWMNLPAPLGQAIVWWVFAGLTAVAGLIIIYRQAINQQQRLLFYILLIWVGGVVLFYLRINMNRLQPQFRFMLALAPVLTSWMSIGVLYWFRRKYLWQQRVMIGTAVLLFLYNIWFIFTVVQNAYGWQL